MSLLTCAHVCFIVIEGKQSFAVFQVSFRELNYLKSFTSSYIIIRVKKTRSKFSIMSCDLLTCRFLVCDTLLRIYGIHRHRHMIIWFIED